MSLNKFGGSSGLCRSVGRSVLGRRGGPFLPRRTRSRSGSGTAIGFVRGYLDSPRIARNLRVAKPPARRTSEGRNYHNKRENRPARACTPPDRSPRPPTPRCSLWVGRGRYGIPPRKSGSTYYGVSLPARPPACLSVSLSVGGVMTPRSYAHSLSPRPPRRARAGSQEATCSAAARAQQSITNRDLN